MTTSYKNIPSSLAPEAGNIKLKNIQVEAHLTDLKMVRRFAESWVEERKSHLNGTTGTMQLVYFPAPTQIAFLLHFFCEMENVSNEWDSSSDGDVLSKQEERQKKCLKSHLRSNSKVTMAGYFLYLCPE